MVNKTGCSVILKGKMRGYIMSYVSTYDRRMPKPKGVGLAIGVHALVIAAVIAMPGISHFQQERGKTDGTFITLPEPDEPVVEKQDPIVELPPKNTIDNPVKQTDDPPRVPEITPTPFTSSGNEITYGTGTGDGFGVPVDPLESIEMTPDPVLIDAKLNPRFASQFQPRYPTSMIRLEQQGLVSVRVLVGTDGRAKDIKLLGTPHEDLWDATRRHALKKWRFNPATEDGKPIESWITLKVRFELNA